MSRWLSSVNNLLENLDGQAGSVAETVAEQATTAGISSNLRRLNTTLASNASALTNNISKVASGTVESDDDYDDEYYDDDDEFFQDDDFGDDEEFTTDEDDYNDDDEAVDPRSVEEPREDSETASFEVPAPTSINNENIETEADGGISDGNKINGSMDTIVLSSVNKDVSDTQQRQNPPTQTTLPEANALPDYQSQEQSLPETFREYQVPVKDASETKEPTERRTKIESRRKNFVAGREQESKPPPKAAKENESLTAPQDEDPSSALLQPPSPDAKDSQPTKTHNASLEREHEMKSADPSSTPSQVESLKQEHKALLQQQDAKFQKKLQQHQQQYQQSIASKNKTIQSLQSQITQLRDDITKDALKTQDLEQQTRALEDQVQAHEKEIEAQAKELSRAGEEMEKIRTHAKEEREDLMDDHDDAMEDAQKAHEDALNKLRAEYEQQVAEWKDRYESEVALRQQEGGDSVRELMDANQREKEALKELAAVTAEKEALAVELDGVKNQESSLQQQFDASLESAQTVAANEQRAREDLEKANALHAKQLAQRQAREAELEQTILEMGSALTLAKQELQSSKQTSILEDRNDQSPLQYKEQWEQVSEELETLNVQFTMESQRREALQQQLSEVAKERKQELSLAQAKQQEHDRKVGDLEATIRRLQESIRTKAPENISPNGSTGASNKLSQELESARKEITKLSEQLLKQQGLAKNSKSEILALKGRLQAANARAEEAEAARFHTPKTAISRSAYDVESGTGGLSRNTKVFAARKRVKGGSGRSVRSIRSSLPCFDNGPAMDQVGMTIDAIDSWMVDTGSFLRHEPLARLGFLMYLTILHLWSFALVAFHTTEVEHGDFGSMDSNPRHWREHGS